MIHQTAIIDKSAVIGKDVEIGPYAVIGENVSIGDGTVVFSHAVVECAEIGKNCKIFSHSAVGTAPQDLKYAGEKTKVIIGDGTVIREYATVNRGTVAHGQTVVGKNCLLMTSSHIAHDCIVGNNVIIANCCAAAGHVEIEDNVVIGGLAAVHQFTRIGRNAMIGGGAMVTMDVIPYAQAQGDRARLAGLNLVGLKRRQMPIEDIENIKHAYRVLFMSKLPLEQALLKLEEMKDCAPVNEIITFIKKSQRGICRHR
ncbi:MAG: acyl-ACP--UDP-N-acetylglucosamine O-acyltransferase [Endomicrobiaceae bacterium]|nr:acyl-ACP--UDP-N-acetylglucosamine O-acyltransferase [Endomicrobiaceae bacterium]